MNLKYWLSAGKHYLDKVLDGDTNAIKNLDICIKRIGLMLNLDFVDAECWLIEHSQIIG